MLRKLHCRKFPSQAWMAGLMGLLCVAAISLRAHPHEATEYQVKAAYLYQFLNFVEWPEAAFITADASFQICVLGNDPFGSDLDDIVRGKQVRGRAVEVRRLNSASGVRACHVLFVAESERTRLRWSLEAAAGRPVLTVSDVRDFEQLGGIIGFTLERGSVRVRINAGAAAASGLQISSKLLAVATVIARKDISP